MALHETDEEQRIKALLKAEMDFDGPPEDRERRLRAVATMGTAVDRIMGLRSLQLQDFSSTCKRLQEAIRSTQPVERADLTLPEPEVLQAYLRITIADVHDIATLPDQLFARLAAELGPEEAIARLGGSPFTPGTKMIAAIETTVRDAINTGHFPNLRVDTALTALAYLRGCKTQGAQTSETVIGYLIDPLLQQKSLFSIALLSHAAARAERNSSWSRIPRAVAALLIWVWADRLTAALIAGGADAKGAAKIISEDIVGRLAEMIVPGAFPDGGERPYPLCYMATS